MFNLATFGHIRSAGSHMAELPKLFEQLDKVSIQTWDNTYPTNPAAWHNYNLNPKNIDTSILQNYISRCNELRIDIRSQDKVFPQSTEIPVFDKINFAQKTAIDNIKDPDNKVTALIRNDVKIKNKAKFRKIVNDLSADCIYIFCNLGDSSILHETQNNISLLRNARACDVVIFSSLKLHQQRLKFLSENRAKFATSENPNGNFLLELGNEINVPINILNFKYGIDWEIHRPFAGKIRHFANKYFTRNK